MTAIKAMTPPCMLSRFTIPAAEFLLLVFAPAEAVGLRSPDAVLPVALVGDAGVTTGAL
jgi:hypothetical protein